MWLYDSTNAGSTIKTHDRRKSMPDNRINNNNSNESLGVRAGRWGLATTSENACVNVYWSSPLITLSASFGISSLDLQPPKTEPFSCRPTIK